ncbi:MAG: methyltransferase, partial [Cellvibrionales bacterium]
MPARTEALPRTEPSTRVSLRLRWHRFRNSLIAKPSFQRWAARTPIARFIANRRATQLHHITAGFVYSQTLMAFLDLELPQRLADGPVTSEQLV